ncbi:ABC transporter permease [Microbacterium sp.]|uniref:ABC transporter permease n=1 Tax=Microbacterium sp. TaxID=51671 RepID=UPI0025CE2FCD|nr:ABC transporter permease [Microbacterium sp.]
MVVLRRLAVSIPMIFIIASLTFFLISLIPGDPAVSILGGDATPAEYARVRAELGLDRPIFAQYVNWMVSALHGDLGNSLRTGRPVVEMIGERMQVTVSVAVIAIIVTAILGVLIGLVGALRSGWVGRSSQVVAVLGTSVPNFWFGILLVLIFAVTLGWLPATGYSPLESGFVPWIQHLILPVAAIAFASIAGVARQTRAAMNEVLGRDFIRTLMASGASYSRVVFVHGLRNAAIPVVTSLSFQFIGLLSGAIVVDQVFAMPGLGSIMLVAINGRDVPVVQGVVILTTILVLTVNLIVDLVNAWLNPKVRI